MTWLYRSLMDILVEGGKGVGVTGTEGVLEAREETPASM